MSSLIEKVAGVLPALEEQGPVYLFAFAEREDVNLWDIVLSSGAADEDWAGSVRFVVDLLWPVLEPQERTMIARVAVIPSNDPKVREMPASMDGVEPGDKKVIYVSLLGSDVRRAFIFKAQHPPVVSLSESLASADLHA